MRLLAWRECGRMLLIAAAAVGLVLMTAGCGKKDAPATDSASPGTFTDGRDGQKYKTVKIGNQTWMAENLNYRTESGSWCYENSADSCTKYGRLYDWHTAKTVCPAGWKLPDTADWRKLVTTAGGPETAGKKLKSKSGWNWNNDNNVSGNGTDDYGFAALPGGSRYRAGGFGIAGRDGDWWTATEIDGSDACRRFMSYHDDYVDEDGNTEDNKSDGYSVRCLMGAKPPEKTGQEPGSKDAEQFTDNRDGQKYRTVKIGPQTWMAQNLNYQIGSSWCYDNDNSNCEKYGRLYGWNTAKVACPAGWKLPSRQDWDELVSACGGDAQNKCLKSKTGWTEAEAGSNGWDNYGFSALPGGNRRHDGGFSNAGYNGDWWTATDDSESGGAYSRDMAYDNDNVNEDYNAKGLGFSVRCVQDANK